MGCLFSSPADHYRQYQDDLKKVNTKVYRNYDELRVDLRTAGLEASDLIIGIDFTGSNEDDQAPFVSNGGKPLHTLFENQMNQYEMALSFIYMSLFRFDDDKQVPTYGFGDHSTKNFGVFPMGIGHNKESLIQIYRETVRLFNEKQKMMSGPTSFIPLIRQAINIIEQTWTYHILLIITDGFVCDEKETIKMIMEASNYPLSIVVIGVGDGPFDMMKRFDDLPNRRFDNLQFVNFGDHIKNQDNGLKFALDAMAEVPAQYRAIKELGLLTRPQTYQPVMPTSQPVVMPTAPPSE